MPDPTTSSMQAIKAGLAYFALVMGAGFLLGMVRVPFLVPRLGERIAELIEMPLMFVVIGLSARFVIRRFALPTTASVRLKVGFLALALAVCAELLLAVALQGQSLRAYIASRDPVSGSVYLAMLGLFACMPFILARRRLCHHTLSRDRVLEEVTAPAPPATTAAFMQDNFSSGARLLGVAAGASVAFLGVLYACVLGIGLLALPSPDHSIENPWFTLMELLIIAISPSMLALTIALHAWAPSERKAFALASVAFMSLSNVVTCAVHFVVLTVSRQAEFASSDWARLVFSFEWPSITYALDILAWDVFFAFSALFAAATVQGKGLARAVRILLFASAVLAFIGLAGVPLANMQIRNLGIIGYAVLFPIAAGLLARLFIKVKCKSAD